MYKIICDGKEIVRQGVDRISAINGRLTQQINAADQLTFTLPATHPYLSNPQPRSSIVELWRDNECLFIGDVLQVSSDIYNNATFTCQGALAWLNDSVVPHPSFSGSASEYFERLIVKYSGDAEQARELNFGTSDISTTIEIEYLEDIKSVFELVSTILSNVGGYLFLRYEGDNIYVDYLTDKGRTSGQTIRFGENLTGIENFIDASKFITRVYPVGKDGLDIRTVNDGKWFVANSALEATHGVIAATVEYNDIDDANTLKTLATNYLNASAVMGQTLSLTAIDLSLLDSRVDRIEVGDAVKVQSKAHGLDTTLKVVSKETDIINPENSKLELGLTMQSISGMVGSGGGSTSVSGGSVTPIGAVLYNQAQSLTEAEKAQARANIGAGTGSGGGDLTGAVRYDAVQAIADTAKARARNNIGAGTSNFDGQYSSLIGKPTIPTRISQLTNDSGFGTYTKPANGVPKTDLASGVQSSLNNADKAVRYDVQSLTDGQKAQARTNIGAYAKPLYGIPESDLNAEVRAKLNSTTDNIITITTEDADPLYPYMSSKNLAEIKASFIEKSEQFVFYNNISYKLEKIITDNGVEKAVFYSTARLVSNALTYYTCEIYDGEFGYSAADFHTYVVSSGGGGGDATNAVLYTPQSLTPAQKTQARSNIGAYTKPSNGIPKTDLASGVQTSLNNADYAVLYSPQTLTDAQKAQARANIGVSSGGEDLIGAVRYDASQQLTTDQKDIACDNIGAAKIYDNNPFLSVTNLSFDGLCEIFPDSRSTDDPLVDEEVLKIAESSAGNAIILTNIATPTENLDAANKQYVDNHHDASKQDVIADLATIRNGAARGATALQSVPSTYRTAAAQDAIDAQKQHVLTAGANISINQSTNNISAVVPVKSVNSEIGSVYLDATNLKTTIPQPNASTPHEVEIYWDAQTDEGSMTVDGVAATRTNLNEAFSDGVKVNVNINFDGATLLANPIVYGVENDVLYIQCYASGYAYGDGTPVQFWLDAGNILKSQSGSTLNDPMPLPTGSVYTINDYLIALETRIAALENALGGNT